MYWCVVCLFEQYWIEEIGFGFEYVYVMVELVVQLCEVGCY